jgi:hypothetical protein
MHFRSLTAILQVENLLSTQNAKVPVAVAPAASPPEDSVALGLPLPCKKAAARTLAGQNPGTKAFGRTRSAVTPEDFVSQRVASVLQACCLRVARVLVRYC